jgi:hypothetical protein
MDRMISAVGIAIVVASALYLLTLGCGALIRPEIAKRFLGGFATTPRLHFSELALRVLTGSALVLSAPRMAFHPGMAIFGWILIVTSLALALVPWRIHRRFAAWAVPQATRHMRLLGVASISGGIVLLAALVLPCAAD